MRNAESRTGRKRRWTGVVFVACLFCLVAIGGAAWRLWRYERRGVERAVRSDVERRPGINVELTQYDADKLERALADIASLGFYWVRQRFPWQTIEPQPGAYDWEQWDTLVSAVHRQHLGLIAVLDGVPEWARPRATQGQPAAVPLPCVPPGDERAFARFASAFARRYGEFIDYYQVWDEPNLSDSWGGGHVAPCGYAVLLEAAYPAIHAADRVSLVLGGGLAPTQAPGPDNLNDITYLRQLYAAGGGAYFDILAVKPYGFWSGPDDRRVQPDVLNFSRVIALRELMRSRSDGRKSLWAVEWGWNVLPEGWAGDAPPWGSDQVSVQRSRILGALLRVSEEWPWMGVMCWSTYQPDVRPTDPHWGFALRNGDGSASPLYEIAGFITGTGSIVPNESSSVPPVGEVAVFLALVAGLDVALLWRRFGYGAHLCDRLGVLCNWGTSLPAVQHLAGLLALAVLYALTPWPEWILLELLLAALLLRRHPQWTRIGVAFSVPFVYVAKPVGNLMIPPSEVLLLLVWMVVGLNWLEARRWPRLRGKGSALDVMWVLWVALGVLPIFGAPDLPSAWREWRLCMLEPALLYLLLRLEGEGNHDRVVVAWALSGVAVALVGIGQFVAGSLVFAGVLVPAGRVGRVVGVYYSPNHLALYLERVWPLCLALAVCGRLRGWWRWGARAAVAVMGVALYLTYSRGTWLLGVPVALLVVGWLCLRPLRWRVVVGVGVGLLLVAASIVYGRIAPDADQMRVPVWQSTLQMIADHPWLGVGPDGFRFVYPRYMKVEAWTEPLIYHPHNVWLDVGVRLGIPGLLGFVVLTVLCLLRAGRKSKEGSPRGRAVAIGCLAGLLAGLAHGTVDSGYFLIDLAWSLALVAGLEVDTRVDT